MTDRLAEIKARHARDRAIHESMGIPQPPEFFDRTWLIAEVERLRPDAERWRYARQFPDVLMADQESDVYLERYRVREDADAAVDAARKQP